MATSLSYDFNHIHVFCTDLAASERWFVEGLGAELVERRESRGVPSVVLRLGGARVLLRGAREGENLAPAGARHFGTDHFGLEVSDVDATIQELKGRGVFVEVEPWDFSPQMRIAFVKGPDEVRIELVQPRA
jgi:catechol 2,3-dioxygenase-like lactoylglutathione lyase family enzyme